MRTEKTEKKIHSDVKRHREKYYYKEKSPEKMQMMKLFVYVCACVCVNACACERGVIMVYRPAVCSLLVSR